MGPNSAPSEEPALPEHMARKHIATLPAAALRRVGKFLLISHPQSVLSQRCACKLFHGKLAGLVATVETKCRLLWDRQRTAVYTVSADGSTIASPCPRTP